MTCVPYAPDTGLFYTTKTFVQYSTASFGPYSLTRSYDKVEVKEGGVLIYSHSARQNYFTGYMYYGNSNRYLLVLDTYDDGIQVHYELYLADLAVKPVVQRTLFTALSFFKTDRPQPHAYPSPGNGLAVFVWIGTNDYVSGAVKNATIYRSDTGAVLCSMSPFTPSVQAIAEATSTSVRIKDGGTTLRQCPLPRGKLDISPDSMPFGSICANTTTTRSSTFTNTGNDCLEVTAISSSIHFRPVGFSPFTLSPGGSQTVNIEFNPANAVGTFTERIDVTRVPPNGDDRITLNGTSLPAVSRISVSPGLRNFGRLCVGKSAEKSFSITNSGCVPATVAATSPNLPFSIVTPLPITVNPQQTIELKVRFAPTADGTYSDTVTIDSITLSLFGEGDSKPRISANASSKNFGRLCAGKFTDFSFAITNSGCAPASIKVTGPNPPFSVVTPLPGMINPGETKLLVVRFAPTAGGTYSDTVIINSDGANPQVLSLSLLGEGDAKPFIVCTAKDHDFGIVEFNVPGVRFPEFTFNIRNNGCVPASINVTGPNPPFSVVIPLPSTINPLQTKPLRVRFKPTADGTYSDTIAISSDGANPQTLLLSLFGEAVSVDIDAECASLEAELADLQAELNGTGPYSGAGGIGRRPKSVVVRDIKNVRARMGSLGCE